MSKKNEQKIERCNDLANTWSGKALMCGGLAVLSAIASAWAALDQGVGRKNADDRFKDEVVAQAVKQLPPKQHTGSVVISV